MSTFDRPAPAAGAPAAPPGAETRGLLLGALGVAIFAMTLPMTRLAVGDAAAPQLPPAFVTTGRAAVAGLLSLAWLWAVRAAAPRRGLWGVLAVSAAGTVLGFPLCLALALRQVDAMHAAVVTGVLPLATAAAAAASARQRVAWRFWAWAVAGCALVLGYAALQGGGRLVAGDAFLLGAVACGAIGYVAGARASQELPAAQVIGWVLVGSLPLSLPLALWCWPAAPARASAWLGFGYVSVFSMWLGFFAWYRGLALGGVMRVSQVQLIQPFLAVLMAVPVLGEPLDPATLVFALAVIATVAFGRRVPLAPAAPQPAVPAPMKGAP